MTDWPLFRGPTRPGAANYSLWAKYWTQLWNQQSLLRLCLLFNVVCRFRWVMHFPRKKWCVGPPCLRESAMALATSVFVGDGNCKMGVPVSTKNGQYEGSICNQKRGDTAMYYMNWINCIISIPFGLHIFGRHTPCFWVKDPHVGWFTIYHGQVHIFLVSKS